MYRLEYDNLTNIFIILALTWNGFIPRSWLVASPFFFGVFQRLWFLVEVWLSSVPRQQPDLSTFQRLCWNPHGGWLFRLGGPLRAGKHRAIPPVGPFGPAGSDQVTVELTAEASGSAWVGELRNG